MVLTRRQMFGGALAAMAGFAADRLGLLKGLAKPAPFPGFNGIWGWTGYSVGTTVSEMDFQPGVVIFFKPPVTVHDGETIHYSVDLTGTRPERVKRVSASVRRKDGTFEPIECRVQS